MNINVGQVIPKPGTDKERHLFVLGLILIFMTFSYHGGFNYIMSLLGKSHIDQINTQYLSSSLAHSEDLLEVVSALKVILNLLQSSSGGISFFIDVQIQLGQALNTLTELVNHAWLFSIVSVASIHIMQLLQDMSHQSTTVVMTLFFCILGISVAAQNRLPALSKSLSHISHILFFLILFVHLVIPLTLYGMAMVGHTFLHEHKAMVKQAYEHHYEHMPKQDMSGGLHSQVKGSINQFKTHQKKAKKQSESFSSLTVRHIVLVFLEGILLPLVFIWLLVELSRSFTRMIVHRHEYL